MPRTHPHAQRRDRELAEAGRSLHLEREGCRVDVEREVVPIPYDVVDGRDVVLPGFEQHAGPIERLARGHDGYAVAPRDASTGDDGLQEDALRGRLLRWCEHVQLSGSPAGLGQKAALQSTWWPVIVSRALGSGAPLAPRLVLANFVRVPAPPTTHKLPSASNARPTGRLREIPVEESTI